jgi:hypothetical protein
MATSQKADSKLATVCCKSVFCNQASTNRFKQNILRRLHKYLRCWLRQRLWLLRFKRIKFYDDGKLENGYFLLLYCYYSVTTHRMSTNVTTYRLQVQLQLRLLRLQFLWINWYYYDFHDQYSVFGNNEYVDDYDFYDFFNFGRLRLPKNIQRLRPWQCICNNESTFVTYYFIYLHYVWAIYVKTCVWNGDEWI